MANYNWPAETITAEPIKVGDHPEQLLISWKENGNIVVQLEGLRNLNTLVLDLEKAREFFKALDLAIDIGWLIKTREDYKNAINAIRENN